jgi:hypothetical protein
MAISVSGCLYLSNTVRPSFTRSPDSLPHPIVLASNRLKPFLPSTLSFSLNACPYISSACSDLRRRLNIYARLFILASVEGCSFPAPFPSALMLVAVSLRSAYTCLGYLVLRQVMHADQCGSGNYANSAKRHASLNTGLGEPIRSLSANPALCKGKLQEVQ